MSQEAPTRGNRRGFRRRWFGLGVAALPVAVLLLGNLWLACPPGRQWIAGKIQRSAGLEVRVGGASVWPWSGVTVREVELLQPPALRSSLPEPFARVTMIRLTPVWRSWLRGKRELRALELDSLELFIPVEVLADLARSQTPPPPAAPPAGPRVAAVAPPFVGPPAPTPPAPTPPAPTPPVTPAAPPAAVADVPLPPTVWLHLQNASFTVFSAASGKSWFELAGLSGSIPVAGTAAESGLRVRSIYAGGNEILTGLDAALDWKKPLLSLKPLETEIHGCKFVIAGKLGMLNGLPVQIDAQLPRQALAPVPLPAQSHAEAGAIAANARFHGLLLAPGSWQGDLVAEAQGASATIAGHEAKFDHGSAITVLRGGLLSCIDARLIGDDLSFLGNATLLADGRAAAALRMVAAPESANAIAGRIFPAIRQDPSLTPLATSQRAAFDLEAFGNIRQLFLRLGHDGPIVELKR